MDHHRNHKRLVKEGYDQCAEAYAKARQRESQPGLELLLPRLSAGARILDVGCGAGIPVAQLLVQRFRVTGVDISTEQIRLARRNVPTACFIEGDIMGLDFPKSNFDAVVAFYSIFHLPREEHAELFRRIRHWLKPGGYLLATVNEIAEELYKEDDFFGATMYWSNYGLDYYQAILTESGFKLLETASVGHGFTAETQAPPEHHPLILAQAAEGDFTVCEGV